MTESKASCRNALFLAHRDVLVYVFSLFAPPRSRNGSALIETNECSALNWKKDLCNFMLVCKAWSDPALNALWSHLDNLAPLLKLHSSLREIDGSYFFLGSSSAGDVPGLNAGAKFNRYARAVRSLSLTAEGSKKTLPISLAGMAWLGQELKGVPLLPGLRRLYFSDPNSDSVHMGLLALILSPTIEAIAFNGTFLSANTFHAYALPLVGRAAPTLRNLSLHDEKTAVPTSIWNSLPAVLSNLQLQTLSIRFPNNPALEAKFFGVLGKSLPNLTTLTLDVHTPSHGPSAEALGQELLPHLKTLHLVNRSECSICQCYPRFLLQRATSITFHLSANVPGSNAFGPSIETLSTIHSLREVEISTVYTVNRLSLVPFFQSLDLESFKMGSGSIRIENGHAGLEIRDFIEAAYGGTDRKRKWHLRELATPTLRYNSANHLTNYAPISALVHIAQHGKGLERISLPINSIMPGTNQETLKSMIESWKAPAIPSTLRQLNIADMRPCGQGRSNDFKPGEYRELSRLLDMIFPDLETITVMKGPRKERCWDEDWELIEESRLMRKALRISGKRVEPYVIAEG
ncbi:hypothetical protein DFP72DRAFT_152130 [Ephemerocybe angulata]|uniref:F-box domain-containing protein n=1 Tax=Ephemerocybe angulata TaxID=980116 RepID=A0A8H6LTB4_9AGAR|nr:hypothetical protein DFP72DRAFT_152130 [Tulosesus angulatus]